MTNKYLLFYSKNSYSLYHPVKIMAIFFLFKRGKKVNDIKINKIIYIYKDKRYKDKRYKRYYYFKYYY